MIASCRQWIRLQTPQLHSVGVMKLPHGNSTSSQPDIITDGIHRNHRYLYLRYIYIYIELEMWVIIFSTCHHRIQTQTPQLHTVHAIKDHYNNTRSSQPDSVNDDIHRNHRCSLFQNWRRG